MTLRVFVDGSFEQERAFDGCAFNGVWECTVDKQAGELMEIRAAAPGGEWPPFERR